MRIIFDREELLYGVTLAQRIAPARYPMAVVTGLLIKTIDSNTVEIVGNDMEISLRITINAKVEEPGEAVLPARSFADFVRRLPPGEVTLSLPENEYLAKVASHQLDADLRSMDPKEYPVIPQIDYEEVWRAPQKILKEAINSVSFAISSDESRPALTGMLLKLSPDGCRVIAMDGFRFAEMHLPLASPVERECIIPGKAVKDLERLLADDDEPFEAQISNNHILVKFQRLVFQSRLIEAPFPFKNASELLRKEIITTAIIPRKLMIECIERALILTREDAKSANAIRFNIADSEVIITSAAPDVGYLVENINIEHHGDDLIIGFNGRYLLDTLNAIKDDLVHFKFTSALTAALIKPNQTETFLTILSPIRLNNV